MRGLKFRSDGREYEAGDERCYVAVYRGVSIGHVESMELPVGDREGDFAKGWVFSGRTLDGRPVCGEGRTRAAAVAAALAVPAV